MKYSGPFIIENWSNNEKIILTRNTHYYEMASDSYIDEINIHNLLESEDIIEAYRNKEIDFISSHWDMENISRSIDNASTQIKNGKDIVTL